MLNGVDLIYDERDQIIKPIQEQHPHWREDVQHTQYDECKIQHLKNHFYLVQC
jgi:hypothetical protein